MIVCLVEMSSASGKHADLLKLCEEGLPRARKAGCLHAEILLDPLDEDRIVVLERWPSLAAFETFSRSEMADAALMARLKVLSAGTPSLRKLEPHR